MTYILTLALATVLAATVVPTLAAPTADSTNPALVSRLRTPPVQDHDQAESTTEKRRLATVYDKCKVPNTVALTFDDGPYLYEKDLIPILRKYNAKATFFLNGYNYGCIYDNQQAQAVKALRDNGHQLASHTWSHPHMNSLNWNQIHSEMYKIEQALLKVAGVMPLLFRPPFGEYNDLVLSAVAARNQSAVIWDFDDGDSVGATVAESKALYDQLANQRPSNALALNHSVYKTTVFDVIPHALAVLSKKGYKFVTVSECLGLSKKYQYEQAPGTRDGSWKC